jgi:hypothetical protein
MDRALEAGARIIIAPELAVDGELLADRLDALEDDLLLLTGSRHHREGGVTVNHATALLPHQPLRLTQRKIMRFTSEVGSAPGSREGIDRVEPVQQRCYQAGPYRLAMPICKDLLDGSLATARYRNRRPQCPMAARPALRQSCRPRPAEHRLRPTAGSARTPARAPGLHALEVRRRCAVSRRRRGLAHLQRHL